MENESLKMCLSATLDNALHIKGSTSLYEGKNGDVTEIFNFQRKYGHHAVLVYDRKMAKAGLSYNTIKNVYAHSCEKGVVALMTGAQEGRHARVTSNAEILTKVVFFRNKHHEYNSFDILLIMHIMHLSMLSPRGGGPQGEDV